MSRKRRMWISGSLAVLLLLIIFIAFRRPLLFEAGQILVHDEAPQKSDVEVALGGDTRGNRIMKACELVREGYAPKVYASGGGEVYGYHESELEIAFAEHHGCPTEYMVPFKVPVSSTFEEATSLIAEFRRLGIHKVLIVTGPSHTARAGRIFRHLAPEMEFHTVAAKDPEWHNGLWWQSREGQKTWLLESVKSVTELFGI